MLSDMSIKDGNKGKQLALAGQLTHYVITLLVSKHLAQSM